MKLPRTLHIEGSRMPPGQHDPEAISFSELAGQFLVIEEKVDGAGVSVEFDDSLNLIVNHRGSPAVGPEFKKLHQWVAQRHDDLFNILETRYVMFGEWMLKKHTIFYNNLPDYFLESDVYDKKTNQWLSTTKRQNLFKNQKIYSVPVLGDGKYEKLDAVLAYMDYSCFIEPLTIFNMEGLYIKQEDHDQVIGRYKYVRYEFLKQILDSGKHVRDREIIPNQLTGGKLWL